MNVLVRIVALGCALGVLSVASIARAASVSWVPDADGAWITPTNWSSNPALPGAADDVAISLAGDRLITLSGGSTQTIKSLNSNERLLLSGSTLVVGTTAQLTNTLTLSGATLRGGAYTMSGGGSIIVQSGTFDGLTVNGPIDVTTLNNANVDVLNSLVLNNVMSLGKADGSAYGRAYFGLSTTSAGSLSGTGSVLFGGTTNNVLFNESNLAGAAGTFTIGSGILVHGKSGQVLNDYGNGTTINQGTIAADVSGGTFIVNNSNGSFVNQKTISAAAGTTMTIGALWTNAAGANVTATGATLNLGTNGFAWSNAGTITVDATTLNVAGNVTQAGLGTINRTGGTVNLNGTLTGNLALTAATGSWVLNQSATIRNGTYSATGGAVLLVQSG
ncbi:MAG: tandem-95 repeat protein, partial [Phycisphaerales bacterium]|nr:tandem-95 repeat protein [Phycisphaerales bacterium]